ncbi:MAG: glycoside hydrolase family 127 protein [Clostridia bacterium]|nr:glycoside hydrolase family 127 protein [Clostridia bacterium]
MENFNLFQVKLTGGFFAEQQKLNADVTLHSVYERFAETGRFKALKCKNEEPHAHIYWDSDVAKWIEAAAYLLSRKEDASIRARYEEAVCDIIANQCENGYFNSHFQVYEPENVFTRRHDHELYCAGHIFEAAVAASEYLHDDRLLAFSEKYVDYIYERFVVKQDTFFTTPGHEEIEIALLRLYTLTKKEKYKELAAFFLDMRGKTENAQEKKDVRFQSHLPVREQTTAVGHAVRALYLYTAMADMAQIEKDETLKNVVESLFEDIVNHKMYITGGVGADPLKEGFASPFDLPLHNAYCETCAAIAFAFFCDKLSLLSGDKKYADIFERVLYNGILAGISRSGDKFFYANPIEVYLPRIQRNAGRPHSFPAKRLQVFNTSCCPPNVCRFFERLPQYVWYSDVSNSTLVLSQFISCALHSEFVDADVVSDFPYSGKVRIKIHSHGQKILFKVRKPEWSDETFDNEKDGYLVYEQVFDGEELILDFKPTLKKVYANAQVAEAADKVAFTFGPLVLCAEGADNPLPLFSTRIGDIKDAKLTFRADAPTPFAAYLPARYRENENGLYAYTKTEKDCTLTLIPYFAWANRGENDMRIWFAEY